MFILLVKCVYVSPGCRHNVTYADGLVYMATVGMEEIRNYGGLVYCSQIPGFSDSEVRKG